MKAFENEKERIIRESQIEKIKRYESGRVSSRAIELSKITGADPEDCLRGIKAMMVIYDVNVCEAFEYLVKGYKHYNHEESKDVSKDSEGDKPFGEMTKPEPFLKIELDEYKSIPRVWYKGESLDTKGLINVKFDWQTNDEFVRLPEIFIKYAEVSDKELTITEIQRYKETDEG